MCVLSWSKDMSIEGSIIGSVPKAYLSLPTCHCNNRAVTDTCRSPPARVHNRGNDTPSLSNKNALIARTQCPANEGLKREIDFKEYLPILGHGKKWKKGERTLVRHGVLLVWVSVQNESKENRVLHMSYSVVNWAPCLFFYASSPTSGTLYRDHDCRHICLFVHYIYFGEMSH